MTSWNQQTMCQNGMLLEVYNTCINGNNNCIYGDRNTIHGNNNKVYGAHVEVYGNGNVVSGRNALAHGKNNVVTGVNSSSLELDRPAYSSQNSVVLEIPRPTSPIKQNQAEPKTASIFPEARSPKPASDTDVACYLCETNIPTVITSPCGHTAGCVPCCLKLKDSKTTESGKHMCPQCRGEVTQFVHCFLP